MFKTSTEFVLLTKENTGYIFGFLAVLAFSLTLPITKYLTDTLSVWDIGIGRSFLAAVAAGVILIIYKQKLPTLSQWLRLCVVASGIAFGFPILTAVGMQTVPSSHGGIILGGLPLATAIIGCFLSGERPSPVFWLLAIAGFSVIAAYSIMTAGSVHELHVYIGDFALLGAVLFAGLGYAQGGLLARELGGWQVICWTLVVALPVLVPLTIYSVNFTAFESLPLFGWAAFTFLALINSLVGFFFWYKALAIGGVSKISQVQLLQTFFTFGFAALWLGENITPGMFTFLIITIVIVWLSKKTPVNAKKG